MRQLLKARRTWLRQRLQPWETVRYGEIDVYWKRSLQGGGHTFGQQFVELAAGREWPRDQRVMEWCAGPGFIGFSLLAHGYCDSLCLADINPRAVEACRRTVRENGLEDRVTVHHSDNFDAIPPDAQFDLIVGNPPHFVDSNVGNIRAHDPEWRVHEGFFASVDRHLAPNGTILLQENNLGSSAATFRPMIERNGLKIAFETQHETPRSARSEMYFIGCLRDGDTAPGWMA